MRQYSLLQLHATLSSPSWLEGGVSTHASQTDPAEPFHPAPEYLLLRCHDLLSSVSKSLQ